PGTESRLRARPGARSRTGSLPRAGRGLPREPGRSFFQYFALLTQASNLASKRVQLLALGGRQAVRTLASIELRPALPVPDRLRGDVELSREALGRAPGSDVVEQSLPKLSRVGRVVLGHRGDLLSQAPDPPRSSGHPIRPLPRLDRRRERRHGRRAAATLREGRASLRRALARASRQGDRAEGPGRAEPLDASAPAPRCPASERDRRAARGARRG